MLFISILLKTAEISPCGIGTKITKSVYEVLTKENSRNHFKHIWKAKMPYKIKIFMWLVENNDILIKDNLLRRHWVGDPTCSFCHDTESIEHLFFQCPIAKK